MATSGSGSGKRVRLPRLPVPPLRQTLDKYVKSLEPFLLEEASRTGVLFEEELVAFVLATHSQDFSL